MAREKKRKERQLTVDDIPDDGDPLYEEAEYEDDCCNDDDGIDLEEMIKELLAMQDKLTKQLVERLDEIAATAEDIDTRLQKQKVPQYIREHITKRITDLIIDTSGTDIIGKLL